MTVPELCRHEPCKCFVAEAETFCSEICAMLGAGLVNRVKLSSALPLKPDDQIVPKCACGHDGCGDSLVTGQVQ